MTNSQPNLAELAKQGDVEAIATFINGLLQPKNITAKTACKDNCLQVMLESEAIPNQQVLVEFVQKSILFLEPASIQKLRIYGRQRGEDFPAWQQELDISKVSTQLVSNAEPETVVGTSTAISLPEETSILAASLETTSQLQTSTQTSRSLWGSVFGAVAGAAGAVGNAAAQAGGAVVGTAVGAAGAVGSAATHAGGAIVGTAVGIGGAVGNTAVQAGGAVLGTAVGVGGAMGNAAWHATDGI
ncbi:MAG TPA: hypothetical protein V6D04_04880, partial [Candidatus Obscuribacterales bacterium]